MSDAPITPEFQAKAPKIMRFIIKEMERINGTEVSAEDAAAILGSFGVETGGFTLREEAGGGGGYGWAQWTGERRDDMEVWCADNSYEPYAENEEDYDEACMAFFLHEVTDTWEERVFTIGGTINGVFYPPLSDAKTLDDKTLSFWKLYERPGTPHEDWRRAMAHEALRLYGGAPIEQPPPTQEHTMPYGRICISSGHGLYVRGASGILDEVDEARKVTESLAEALRERGVEVETFHDDVSKSQSENLNRITDWHNGRTRDLDISVHFNAFEQKEGPMGCEVLYVTQADLAGALSAAISEGGDLINRGGKYRSDLHFLNATEMPSVLLETCFVDSEADANLYEDNYGGIIDALATELTGLESTDGEDNEDGEERPPLRPVRPPRPPRPRPIPRIDIEVSGEVIIFVNGEQVGTQGR